MLILILWLPASTNTLNKQEQPTPYRREPSGLLALSVNILPVFKNERDKSRKLMYLKSRSDGMFVRSPYCLVNKFCVK